MEKIPQIVGVTGRKYNGKDTIGDYLVKNYGYTKLSFASPLKEMCKMLFGFTDEQLYGDLKETIDVRWNQSPRVIMQYFGTDLIRDKIGVVLPDTNNDFWVKCLMNKVDALMNENPNSRFVICDVRFHNEIEAIKRCKYTNVVIKVDRPDIISNDVHISETLIDFLPFDTLITNDKQICHLYKQVDDLLLNK